MLTILYVEDDAGHALLVKNLLNSRGFHVETAPDGYKGLEMARKLRPDLILLDLFLPHMDGFAVMKSLNEDVLTQDIPVVVISAWPTADNRKRVKEAGARGFVTKPFRVEDLIAFIRNSLPKYGEGPSQPYPSQPSSASS
jgi:DNA-binding response OmpR family regulator